jgi:hypothetical protein
MEPLRISIPKVEFCVVDTCFNYVSSYSFYHICHRCIMESNPRMGKEMAAATLACKTQFVHCTALGSSSGRLRKIH